MIAAAWPVASVNPTHFTDLELLCEPDTRPGDAEAKMIGLLMMLAGPDLIAFETGNALYADCVSALPMRTQACRSYIAGVADAARSFRGTGAVKIACIPMGATTQQLSDVVIGSLRAAPEMRHLLASDLVLSALNEAYPCRE